MIKKMNCKGVSLIELLVTIAVMAVVSPVIFLVFVSGLQSYVGGTNYIDQQYKSQEVLTSIKQDVEKCKKVTFIDRKITDTVDVYNMVRFDFNEDGSDYKIWRFEHNQLQVSINSESNFIRVVSEIDSDKSFFGHFEDPISDNIEQLVLSILPLNNDKVFNRGSNVQELITTEFSVRYKGIYFIY